MTEAETQSNPFKSLAVVGGKALAGGVLGFGVANIIPPLFWFGVRKLKPNIQTPIRRLTPGHNRIGESVLIAGIIARNPILAGFGGGLVASNSDDSVMRKQKMLQEEAKYPDRLNIVRYNIPSWLPWKVQYDMLGDILVEIITKPTFNKERGVWIPPGREHPDVIATARQIVVSNKLDGHDKIAVLKAIQQWVRDNITYVYDPRWLDTFVHPYHTLKLKSGDCDDQTLLTSSLGEAVGIPMVLILVGQRDPEQFNHILAGGVVNGRIYPMETILKNRPTPLGWLPPHVHKRIISIP